MISCLWETLLDLDDLTASTNSIMTLLATLLAHPHVAADRLVLRVGKDWCYAWGKIGVTRGERLVLRMGKDWCYAWGKIGVTHGERLVLRVGKDWCYAWGKIGVTRGERRLQILSFV